MSVQTAITPNNCCSNLGNPYLLPANISGIITAAYTPAHKVGIAEIITDLCVPTLSAERVIRSNTQTGEATIPAGMATISATIVAMRKAGNRAGKLMWLTLE